jgi:uncharacterized DUF497 family protein
VATVVFEAFEWDDEKAAANVAKHDVTFEEAATVFADPTALYLKDDAHADRVLTIGMSDRTRVVFVVSSEPGERTRIISARKATPAERRLYQEQRS